MLDATILKDFREPFFLFKMEKLLGSLIACWLSSISMGLVMCHCDSWSDRNGQMESLAQWPRLRFFGVSQTLCAPFSLWIIFPKYWEGKRAPTFPPGKPQELGFSFCGDVILSTERATNEAQWLKEIKEDLNKWKVIHCHRLEDLILWRWQYSPSWSTRFSAAPAKMTTGLFTERDKLILQFMWKFKGPRITKHTLKSTRLENSYFPIQNFCQSYSNQDSVYWRMVGHIV